MAELEVRIVRLEPMRVASALGYGESPEPLAWDRILSWAKARGLLEDLNAVRFFGFNNPDPSPGTPNYGYEQWITVGPEVEAEEGDEIEIKPFSGGLYAVTRCKGIPQIHPTWKRLVAWYEESDYRRGHQQWLEECLPPLEEHVFDLYLPLAE